jgi:hypothetical protein
MSGRSDARSPFFLSEVPFAKQIATRVKFSKSKALRCDLRFALKSESYRNFISIGTKPPDLILLGYDREGCEGLLLCLQLGNPLL